jgi:hypothetical protein
MGRHPLQRLAPLEVALCLKRPASVSPETGEEGKEKTYYVDR